MAKLNEINCLGTNLNTGASDCPFNPRFEGFIQVPKGKLYTLAEIQTLGATLSAGTKALLGKDRVYPFPTPVKVEPNGGDPEFETFDSNLKVLKKENYYDLEVQYYSGMSMSDFLRSRNGQDIDVICFGQGFIFGTTKNGLYGGVPFLSFHNYAAGIKAFNEINMYKFRASMTVESLNDNNMWFIEDEFNIADLQGLKNVKMTALDTPVLSAAGLATVQVKELYGSNYVDVYGLALSGAPFVATNTATGAVIAPTTITIVGSNLLFTFVTGGANYPVIGGSITITPPNITQLGVAGILNAEIINKLVLTRTV